MTHLEFTVIGLCLMVGLLALAFTWCLCRTASLALGISRVRCDARILYRTLKDHMLRDADDDEPEGTEVTP